MKKKKFYNWSESRKSCHILKRKSSAEISYTLHFQSFTKKKKKKKCNVSFSQGRFLSLSKLVQFFWYDCRVLSLGLALKRQKQYFADIFLPPLSPIQAKQKL
jgi:hypothetical protein